jgi:hypothetical protein
MSGLVVWYKIKDVSDKYGSSIFRIEKYAKQAAKREC